MRLKQVKDLAMYDKVDLNTKNEQDYYTETLWHNDRIISTAVMQKKKLIAFEFNPENI